LYQWHRYFTTKSLEAILYTHPFFKTGVVTGKPVNLDTEPSNEATTESQVVPFKESKIFQSRVKEEYYLDKWGIKLITSVNSLTRATQDDTEQDEEGKSFCAQLKRDALTMSRKQRAEKKIFLTDQVIALGQVMGNLGIWIPENVKEIGGFR
jgi:hypothetical protein